jgi:hypothetical protein
MIRWDESLSGVRVPGGIIQPMAPTQRRAAEEQVHHEDP